MSDYIKTLTSRLEEINRLLTQRAEPKTITLDDAEKLSSFFHDYGDTNQLLDEIGIIEEESIETLKQQMSSLLKVLNNFCNLDWTIWEGADFETIVNMHLKPFDDKHESAIAEAHKLWQDYYHKNNRLDYLPIDSEEYMQLDEECTAAKAKYDEVHSEVEALYNALHQEKERCASIYFFTMGWLEVLIKKLTEIADFIVNEIEERRKEGDYE